MFKFKFDFDLDTDALIDGVKNNVNAALGKTAADLKDEVQRVAAQKLDKGLTHWMNGLTLDRVADGVYVISLQGKLANWMEDGFTGKELKDAILSGNRAQYNKAQGKDYVDVPLKLSADDLAKVNSNSATVSMSKLMDADAVMKQIEVSDYAKKGTRKENRVVQRIRDVIRERKATSAKGVTTGIMTIRRVSPKSKPWKDFPGAKVFDSNTLDLFLDRALELNLKRLL